MCTDWAESEQLLCSDVLETGKLGKHKIWNCHKYTTGSYHLQNFRCRKGNRTHCLVTLCKWSCIHANCPQQTEFTSQLYIRIRQWLMLNHVPFDITSVMGCMCVFNWKFCVLALVSMLIRHVQPKYYLWLHSPLHGNSIRRWNGLFQ